MKELCDFFNFKNKTAIITGSASGIGAAIARRLVEANTNIILIDIDDKSNRELAAELCKTSDRVGVYSFDLSEKESIDCFWEQIDGEDVDILINNVGIYPFVDFLKLDYSGLEKAMQVNLYSALWMSQNMIKARRKKGGQIVNVSSIEAIMPFKDGLTQYSLSKVGVIILSRDLAREYGKLGFRVNTILPGGIVSKGTKAKAKRAITKLDLGLISDGYNFMQRVPVRRLGKPDEIAKMVMVLCSDLASYVNGATIPVDGGFLSS